MCAFVWMVCEWKCIEREYETVLMAAYFVPHWSCLVCKKQKKNSKRKKIFLIILFDTQNIANFPVLFFLFISFLIWLGKKLCIGNVLVSEFGSRLGDTKMCFNRQNGEKNSTIVSVLLFSSKWLSVKTIAFCQIAYKQTIRAIL